MKPITLYLGAAFIALLFSGCTSNSQIVQLQNRSIQQSLVIQQQQRQITALQNKLNAIQQKPTYSPEKIKPKKNIKLKKVEDNNYSSDYMYPDDKKKKTEETAVTTATQTAPMSRAECIAMIGEAKFDRYTQMFGSEAAAIKRCMMIRAMKK
jgi:PBP1b-binding outer membrane lipoprotein LpoB